MCLGIPGQVVSLDGSHPDLVMVDVEGSVKPVNLGLLDGGLAVGDWIVIHMGFALEKMTAEEAEDALSVLNTLGPNAGADPATFEFEDVPPPW